MHRRGGGDKRPRKSLHNNIGCVVLKTCGVCVEGEEGGYAFD